MFDFHYIKILQKLSDSFTNYSFGCWIALHHKIIPNEKINIDRRYFEHAHDV